MEVGIGRDTCGGRAAVLGHFCLRGVVGVWRWGWALRGCEDAVERGLEADHLGVHDLGAHE